MTPLNIRLQALKWLFTAIRPWLFQDQIPAQGFPCGHDMDWKTVGDLAYFHNLEPVLYWVVSNNHGETDVPGWLKEKWEEAYFGNFLKNEEYFGVLEVLLDKCQKRRVPVIVLKGPALIGRIYKDPALRTLSDLDILCSRGDIARLLDIAAQMGYNPMAYGDGLFSTHHVSLRRIDPSRPEDEERASSKAMIEFHFKPYEVIQKHQLFMELAWQRKEWIRINEVDCPVLSFEMEAVFNIAHIVQHQFDVSLKQFLDIAGLLIFSQEIDKLDDVCCLLRSAGLEKEFALILGFLEHILDRSVLPRKACLDNGAGNQDQFNPSLEVLLALLDERRMIDLKGVMWNLRIGLSNRKALRERLAYIGDALFPFFNDLALHPEDCSKSHILSYSWRYLLSYLQLLFLTLMHLPKRHSLDREPSLALERAVARNRITTQLLMGKRGDGKRKQQAH